MSKKFKISIMILFFVFLYVGCFNVSHHVIAVDNLKYGVANALENTITVEDVKNGTFNVNITNVSKGVSKVVVPVWSSKNGQDDLVWYTATRQKDGSFRATVYLKNHKYDSGNYIIHAYLDDSNGKNIAFVNSSKTISINSGNLSFNNINNKNEQLEINLLNTDYYHDKVMFAVWSDAFGQDDVFWYTASKVNGSVKYIVPLKNHKSFGKYFVHVYAIDSKGKGSLINSGTFMIEGPKIIDSDSSFTYNMANGNLDLKVKLSSNVSITKVEIPTWSYIGGQDDIIWYGATNKGGGVYEIHTNISKHHYSLGEYLSHIYVATSNGMYGYVGKFSKQVTSNDKIVANVNKDSTGFNINYKNYSKLKGYDISYAIWSNANGQDDIVWYNVKNQNFTGSFNNHINRNGKADSGTYTIHVYATKNGVGHLVDATTFQVANPKINTVEIVQRGYMVDVYVRNVSNSVTSVQVPFWSNNKWQDDIVWYNASKQGNGVWKVSINLKRHHYETGLYIAHAYIKSKNSCVIAYAESNVSLNKGKLESKRDSTDSNVKLTLSESDFINLGNIRFAVWSQNGGQDDVVWYNGSISGGVASCNVPISKHKTAGKYIVHVYAGSDILFASEFSIDNISFNVDIINVDSKDKEGDGIYQVKISGIKSNSGVSKVEVPVWTASNQNDIYWYQAKKQGNDYIVTVNPKNHKYNSGNYHTHVYVTAGNKIVRGIAKNDTKIDLAVGVKVKGNSKGTYELLVYNTSPKISRVEVPTWSGEGKSDKEQDDIIWYDAIKQKDGSWIAKIKAFDHSPFGKTNSHVYVTINKNKSLVASTSYFTSKYMLNPEYFSQLDGRWRYKEFGVGKGNIGSTGCMPTSIAMAVKGITGKNITPYDVAYYLYYSTNSYNKFYRGAGGDSVKCGASKYGLSYNSLRSLSSVKKALENGKIVIAAVRYGDFVKFVSSTHAIVLYGYENGNTNVYDPYDSGKNGKYSIERIYNQQSTVREDIEAGSPFHALY